MEASTLTHTLEVTLTQLLYISFIFHLIILNKFILKFSFYFCIYS